MTATGFWTAYMGIEGGGPVVASTPQAVFHVAAQDTFTAGAEASQ